MDRLRFMILVLCCLLTFGTYFSYDLPGSLPKEFQQVLGKNETYSVGLFYTFYSIPNTVLPLFAGSLIDHVLGIRKGVIICAILVTLGCTTVAATASIPSWTGTNTALYVSLIGRFLFGLGGETLYVCQNAFCAKWFLGSDLASAFAIALSFSRAGSALNFAIEPKIATDYGFCAALWLSALLCAISLAVACLLAFVDIKYGDPGDNGDVQGDENAGLSLGSDESLSEALLVNHTTVNRSTSISFSDQGQKLLRDENVASDTNHSNRIPEIEINHQEFSKGGSLMEILSVVAGLRVVLIYLICLQFYISVFIFIQVAKNFLITTYDYMTPIYAGLITSLPFTVSAVVSPIVGLTLDKIGRGGYFVGSACAMLCIIHLCFLLIPQMVSPTMLMILLGFAYSTCAASLWPMIAVAVDSRNISTSYGLMTSIQNIGLAIAPLIISKLVPNYEYIELIFSLVAFGGFICTVSLYYVDIHQHNGELFASSSFDATVHGEDGTSISPCPSIPE